MNHAMLCRYTDIFVGQPQVEEDYITSSITPQQCRLRDMTYAAPITVTVTKMMPCHSFFTNPMIYQGFIYGLV